VLTLAEKELGDGGLMPKKRAKKLADEPKL
jgi:hypothetical protein